MDCSIVITDPVKEISLITVAEAKTALKISAATSDDMLEIVIRRASGEIATYCNRVFGKESVIETFREIDTEKRLYLARYPVRKIDSVLVGGSDFTDYELDATSGRLRNLGGFWGDPVTVTYTGGFELPFESPQALRQAAMIYTREAYYAALRGDASIRMIAHKESRVIFFDPNAAARSSGGGGAGGTATQRAVHDLLVHFTRYIC